jgi:DNA-binding transcriptional ArsR family regulator
VADVSPSTGSAHLNRLMAARLLRVQVQGKHRYYMLEGPKWRVCLKG